jgi:hypothetical protein
MWSFIILVRNLLIVTLIYEHNKYLRKLLHNGLYFRSNFLCILSVQKK